jgi:YfiH family protein
MASAAQSQGADTLVLPAWSEASLVHGFLGRTGWLGGEHVQDFNLAYWLDGGPRAASENWRRWRERWPVVEPVCLNQVHGVKVMTVNQADDGRRVSADGCVTAAAGIALCIFTADCVPVLMVDVENHVAGALHAGWRGALGNIAQEGIIAMERLGARRERIQAALGPSIGLCCFEVDAALAEAFLRELPGNAEYVREGRTGKAYLDLRSIISQQLTDCGADAARISAVGPCTKCKSGQYFSRRAAGGAITGLQMSFVGFSA